MANLSNINNILRTGSLGVGINRDPASPFEVSSSTKPGIKMFNTAASGKTYQAYSDVNGNYIIYDEDADSNRLVINSAGNATFAGDVYVTGTSNSNVVISRDNMYVDAGQLYIGADGATTDDTFRQRVTSGSYFIESRKSGTWTNRLQINSAGTLIASQGATFAGTISSSSISAEGMITVTQNDIGTGESVGLRIIRSGGAQIWNITSGITGVDNTTFNVRNSTSNTNVFSIDAGTNAATFVGNITFGDGHFIGDDADDNLLIQSSANENIIINSVDDLFLRTGGTTKLTVKNGGNVGIGTASPAEKLQVQLGNIKIDGGANSNERGLIIAHGGLTGNQTRLVQDSSASIGHLYTTERGLRIQAGKDGSAAGGNLDFYTDGTARYRITTGGGHQWTTDGNFSTSFSYSFRDAVGINNPNSVSAQAVAGYVLSVGRSFSGSIAGGIISQGESHFVRGVSFGSSGQDQVLNYYKEGIWTPTLRFGGNEVGITYGGAPGTVYRGAHYTRVGRVVTFSLRIILTSKGTSTGEATIHGLPFVVANLQGNYGSAMYSFANNFVIPERASITIDNGSSVIRLRFTNTPNGNYGNVTNSDFNNNSDIILTGTYQAAP